MTATYGSAETRTGTAQPLPCTHPPGPIGYTAVFIVIQKEIAGSGPITCTDSSMIKKGEFLSTTGVGGTDTGPVRIAAFAKTLDGSETGVTYTFNGSTDVMLASGYIINASFLGQWTIDCVGGYDVTGDASWSTVMTSINLAVGDLCMFSGVVPTDASGTQFSAETITAAGFTFSAVVEQSDYGSASGRDIAQFVCLQTVTAGTQADVVPTVTATVGGTTTNAYGAALLLRLRHVDTLAGSVEGSYLEVNVGALDITDPAPSREGGSYIELNVGVAEVGGTVVREPWGWGEILTDTMYETYLLPGEGTYLDLNVYDPAVLHPPRNLNTTYVQSLPTVMGLTWAVPTGGGTVTGYDVRIDGGAPTNVGNVFSYDFTVLTPGTLHTFGVRAHWPGGDSAWAEITDTVPVIYPTDVLADTPIAFYRQGDLSLPTMADSSGNARNGTFVGSPTLGAATLLTLGTDPSVNYNGTSQYAEVATGTWMDVTQITVEAWVRAGTTAGAVETIASRWHSSTSAAKSWLLRRDTDGSIGFYWFDTAAAQQSLLTPTYPLVSGLVYHVVATVDSVGVGRVYLNSVLVGTLDPAGTNPMRVVHVQPIRIGSIGGTAGSYWNGRIDEVAVYPTALSLARIQSHYNSGSWT